MPAPWIYAALKLYSKADISMLLGGREWVTSVSSGFSVAPYFT